MHEVNNLSPCRNEPVKVFCRNWIGEILQINKYYQTHINKQK